MSGKSGWRPRQGFDFEGRTAAWDRMGQGPPLVMVHGTPWSSFNLRRLIRGLAEDYAVHYFDLMGYGCSDKSEGDVSLAVQNRLLAALVEEWGLERPLAVGHDFGGATVLRSHLVGGVDFAKMVLIDPVALAPWGSPFFRHVREHEAAFAGAPDFMHEAMVRAYVETAAHEPLAEATMEGIVAPWRGEGKAAFYRQIAQADQRHTDEVQGRYPAIERPVLILWGEEDAWIPVARGRELNGLIPGSELRIVPGAGHLVIEEKPDVLLRHMRAFLKTRKKGPAHGAQGPFFV